MSHRSTEVLAAEILGPASPHVEEPKAATT